MQSVNRELYLDKIKQAFEFKFTSVPKITKSMQSAIDLLKLDKLTIIIPGDANYFLKSNIEVRGLMQ